MLHTPIKIISNHIKAIDLVIVDKIVENVCVSFKTVSLSCDRIVNHFIQILLHTTSGARRAFVELANNSLSFHPNDMKFKYVVVWEDLYVFHIKSKMQMSGHFTYALLALRHPCLTYALLALRHPCLTYALLALRQRLWWSYHFFGSSSYLTNLSVSNPVHILDHDWFACTSKFAQFAHYNGKWADRWDICLCNIMIM